MHSILFLRILIATLPLLLMAGIGILSGSHCKGSTQQRTRRMVIGALRGLAHGPQIKM